MNPYSAHCRLVLSFASAVAVLLVLGACVEDKERHFDSKKTPTAKTRPLVPVLLNDNLDPWGPLLSTHVGNPETSSLKDRLGSNFTFIDGCLVLPGSSCTNHDFSRAELSGENLENADLTATDMTEANLERADLTDANLMGANLTGAVLLSVTALRTNFDSVEAPMANFRNANLAQADLRRANIQQVDFTDADLSGAETWGSRVFTAVWNNTTCPDGTNSDENDSTCEGHFYNGDACVIRPGAECEGAEFIGADLRSVNLRNANLRNARFIGVDLARADLRGADLEGVYWEAVVCPDGVNSNTEAPWTCIGHLTP